MLFLRSSFIIIYPKGGLLAISFIIPILIGSHIEAFQDRDEAQLLIRAGKGSSSSFDIYF